MAAAAALVEKTLEFAEKTKVAAAAQAWFVKSEITHYSDVAVMAAKEGDVNAEIIDVMIADGVNEMKLAGAKVNVKKFWVACRDQYEMDRRPERDASVVIDAPRSRRKRTSSPSGRQGTISFCRTPNC